MPRSGSMGIAFILSGEMMLAESIWADRSAVGTQNAVKM